MTLHLRRESRRLFPWWPISMRAKWVRARMIAKGMKPLYNMRSTPSDYSELYRELVR